MRHSIYLLPPHLARSDDLRWQADCGEDHARGETPVEALETLMAFMALKEKQKCSDSTS